jgi:hypothetical protein
MFEDAAGDGDEDALRELPISCSPSMQIVNIHIKAKWIAVVRFIGCMHTSYIHITY